jgi:hypothetical protein
MEMFHELEQLQDEFQSSSHVLAPEDVSRRMASKASSILLPRFSSAALQRPQHLRIILTDNSHIRYAVPVELRRQWIGLMSAQWRNLNVNFLLYSRERTSIIPPTLFGEDQRVPKDALLYSSDSGVLGGEGRR